MPRKVISEGERKGERWENRLKRGGILNIKVPACLDEYPAFTEALNHIRNHFGDQLKEKEVMKGGRVWIELSLEG